MGSVPKDGGTFTFYRNLRPVLRPYNIDLRCVSVGIEHRDLWEDDYADDGCVLVASGTRSIKRQARAFVDWCEDEQIDIVMGINSAAILSAIPHLPERVRVMSRCANAFDHGYRITLSGEDRLMRIIALSPRLRDDLVANYGADPEMLVLIPNGIAPQPFEKVAAIPRGMRARLELGFLGRLEHNQKGVMHLPEIVAALRRRGVPFRLRIAGKGADGTKLRAALKQEVELGFVEFLGALSSTQIPDFLGATDVLVFTSHFEGIPNALLEAMMAGCVPVSFTIPGITDYVIEDGNTGLLCETGDTERLAALVANLSEDRVRLNLMHRAAATVARDRFAAGIAAKAYAAEFREVMAKPPRAWHPRRWQDFEPDQNFPQSWRQLMPKPLKSVLKMLVNFVQFPGIGSSKGRVITFFCGSEKD